MMIRFRSALAGLGLAAANTAHAVPDAARPPAPAARMAPGGLPERAALWSQAVIPAPGTPAPPPTVPAGPPPPPPTPPYNRRWWPHFERAPYDWQLDPIGSYKLTTADSVAGAARSSGQELGGRAKLSSVGLYRKGHTLVALSLGGGGAMGRIKTTLAELRGYGAAESEFKYVRYFAEAGLGYYYKSFRLLASVARGTLDYKRGSAPLVQDVTGTGDMGLRLARWFSLHGSTIYRHVFAEKFSDPATVELLGWPHAALQYQPWRIEVDVGPGYAYTQESVASEVAAEGWVRLLFLKFKLTNVYNIDVEGRARYVLSTSAAALGRYATTKLGADDMSSPPLLTAPEDTMTLSLFFSQHYHGVKLGYWSNWQIFDYREKAGHKSHTNKESGFGVFLGYAL